MTAKRYYELISEILEYMESCNKRNLVPLKHDVNAFRLKLNRIRRNR